MKMPTENRVRLKNAVGALNSNWGKRQGALNPMKEINIGGFSHHRSDKTLGASISTLQKKVVKYPPM